ncbi:hypothetical protein [Microbacterium sp.]|uniref:hypothetical protein n=1 Tax=Microbacterium sp. TaxID=51671 RepID=UPI000961BB7E|nr:hypothetical protein [Microbacterium sp.]MBN9190279.1 hypothetical protein [Microbacterium sp.]MBN9193352.1 hypothetical protein [Microbacterium sp.]OJV25387.1 MAG: hypothetical protein BGO26_09115 [Actinobacteria bacterium 69-20]
MSSPDASPAPKRLSLPLTAQDLAELEAIRESAQRRGALPGDVQENASEAELVHAVLQAGLARVREAIELAAYGELAEDEDYLAYRAMRREAGESQPGE